MDYYKPAVFDKEVAKILTKEFAKELRSFLNNPQNADAVIKTPVKYSCTLKRVQSFLKKNTLCSI